METQNIYNYELTNKISYVKKAEKGISERKYNS